VNAVATAVRREVPPPLLDDVVPQFDFGSRHELVIAAPAEAVADAAERWSLAADGPAPVRWLFRLRGFVPAPYVGDGLKATFTRAGFGILAERPGSEIVLGIAGRFWALDEPSALRRTPDAAAFRAFAEAGNAKGAMSVRIVPLGPDRTRLETETRVVCVDAAARRRFALYWALVKPFSGWIRRIMLRGIADRALASL
jgi:hypothetical protein